MRTRRRPWAPAPIATLAPLLLALVMMGGARGQQVEVCPDASWHSALLLKSYDGKPPSFFANITTWSATDFKDYALQDLSKAYIPSAVFLGIGLLSLAVLLAWRLLYCCCLGCYRGQRSTTLPLQEENAAPQQPRYMSYMVPDNGAAGSMQRVDGGKAPPPWAPPAPKRRSLKSRCACLGTGSTVLKVLIVALACAAAGLTVWGMTSASKGLADDGWDQVDNVQRYINGVAGDVEALLQSVGSIVPAVTASQAAAQQALSASTVGQTVQELGAVLDSTSLSPTQLSAGTSSLRRTVAALSQAPALLQTALPQAVNADGPALAQAAQDVASSNARLLDAARGLSTLQNQITNLQSLTRPSATAAENVVLAIRQLNLTSNQDYLTSLISSLQTLTNASQAIQAVTAQQSGNGTIALNSTVTGGGAVAQSLAAVEEVASALASTRAQLPALASTIRGYANTTAAAAGAIKSMLLFVDALLIGKGVDTSSNAPLAVLYRRLQSVAALVSDEQRLSSVADVLDSLQGKLADPDGLGTLKSALEQVVSPLSTMPSTAGYLTYLTNLRSSMQALDAPLTKAQSALSAYLEAPSQATWDLAQAVTSDAATQADAAVSASQPATNVASAMATVRSAASDAASSLGQLSTLVTADLQQRVVAGIQAVSAQFAALTAGGGSRRRGLSLSSSSSRALQQQSSSSNGGALLDQLDDAAKAAASTLASWPSPRAPSLQAVGAELVALQQTIQEQGDVLKAAVTATVQQFNTSARDLRQQVASRLDDLRGSYYKPTTKWDGWRYTVTMIVFAVALAALLLACVALLFNIPALLTLSTLALAVLLALYFAVALMLAAAVAGGNDLCPATETIALKYVPARFQPIATYLLFNKSTLEAALKQSDLVDVSQIDGQATTLATSIVGNLTTLLAGADANGTLAAAAATANATLVGVLGAKAALMRTASHSSFIVVYGAAKSYACCQVPDDMVKLWYALTFGGWALLLLTWLAAGLIRTYDTAPGAHAACGWLCLRAPPSLRLDDEDEDDDGRRLAPSAHVPATAPPLTDEDRGSGSSSVGTAHVVVVPPPGTYGAAAYGKDAGAEHHHQGVARHDAICYTEGGAGTDAATESDGTPVYGGAHYSRPADGAGAAAGAAAGGEEHTRPLVAFAGAHSAAVGGSAGKPV